MASAALQRSMPAPRPYGCYPLLALIVFSVLGADGGVVLVRTLGSGSVGGRVLTLLLVLLVGGASTWWWLVCVPSVLDIADGRLRYQAPLASGAVPLDRVYSVRPAPLLGSAAVVRIAGRVPLAFPVRPGWGGVAAHLARHPSRRSPQPRPP